MPVLQKQNGGEDGIRLHHHYLQNSKIGTETAHVCEIYFRFVFNVLASNDRVSALDTLFEPAHSEEGEVSANVRARRPIRRPYGPNVLEPKQRRDEEGPPNVQRPKRI